MNTLADILSVNPGSDRRFRHGDTRGFVRRLGREIGSHVLNMQVLEPWQKTLEELRRILAGEKGVAGIEVQAQPGRVKVIEDPGKYIRIRGKGSVRFDVDCDFIILRPFQDLPVVLDDNGDGLLVAGPQMLEKAPVPVTAKN